MGTNCNTSCSKGIQNDIEAAKQDRRRASKKGKSIQKDISGKLEFDTNQIPHDISPLKSVDLNENSM
jgi:hypothetical protein